MMNLSQLPSRLLPKQRQCSYRGCIQKPDWNRLFHSVQGIELQGEWMCSEACFLAAAQELLSSLGEARTASPSSRTHLPLGLVMVSRGDLTSTQLRAALDYQQKSKPCKRIGDVLKELGVVVETQITRALAEQWSCPVFPLQAAEPPAMPEQLPLQLLETYRMLPVHSAPAARMLLLGFTDALHHSVLYAVGTNVGVPNRGLPYSLKLLSQTARPAACQRGKFADRDRNQHHRNGSGPDFAKLRSPT